MRAHRLRRAAAPSSADAPTPTVVALPPVTFDQGEALTVAIGAAMRGAATPSQLRLLDQHRTALVRALHSAAVQRVSGEASGRANSEVSDVFAAVLWQRFGVRVSDN